MLARLQSVTDRSSVFVSNAVNLKEHTTTLRALVTVQRQSPWLIPRQPSSKSFRLDEWLLCNRTRLDFVLGCIHTRGGGFIGIDIDYVRMFMQCCAGRRDVEIDYKQSLSCVFGPIEPHGLDFEDRHGPWGDVNRLGITLGESMDLNLSQRSALTSSSV